MRGQPQKRREHGGHVNTQQPFVEKIEARWSQGLLACVGLDTDLSRVPEVARRDGVLETLVEFNRQIVDATADLVCAFKPNSAFYEAHGPDGVAALVQTVDFIRRKAPDVPVILDAKRGDIGSSNDAYLAFVHEVVGADAVTVHPYLGKESLEPFLNHATLGVLVLCRTSNPGSGELQDLDVAGSGTLSETVADLVARSWNSNGNCGLVVGATYPDELRSIRDLAPQLPLLIPGVGAQGGDVFEAIDAGWTAPDGRLIVNSSRAILYAGSGPSFAADSRVALEQLDAALRAAVSHRAA
jgi:orotidine-5'-phosphate decarboxylase